MSDPATDARAAVAKVHQIIEHDAANAPRTLQKRIGPSELGVACDRCLVHVVFTRSALHPEDTRCPECRRSQRLEDAS